MRVGIAGAAPRVLKEFRGRVLEIPGVKSAEANPTTGSVLILYSQHGDQDIAQSIVERATDLVAFAPNSYNEIGDYSTTAISLLSAAKQADDELRAGSGGRVDLKLLFPMAMVGLTA